MLYYKTIFVKLCFDLLSCIDWSFVLTIISLGVAILTAIYLRKEYKQNAKVALFDRRIKLIATAEKCINTWENIHHSNITNKKETFLSEYKLLLNDIFPQKDNLSKIDILNQFCDFETQYTLIFKSEKAIVLERFIKKYKDYILKLNIFLDNYDDLKVKINKDNIIENMFSKEQLEKMNAIIELNTIAEDMRLLTKQIESEEVLSDLKKETSLFF